MSEKSCGIYDLVYFDYLSIKLLIKWAALSKGNWHKYSKQTNNDTREIYSLLTTDSPWCYNISITRNSALLSLLGGKLSTGCTLVITTSGPNISLDTWIDKKLLNRGNTFIWCVCAFLKRLSCTIRSVPQQSVIPPPGKENASCCHVEMTRFDTDHWDFDPSFGSINT